MIGFIKGNIVLKDGNHIVVETSGVGYRVLVPAKTLSKRNGENISLFTHTHVREEALELFGFEDLKDLKLFEGLISVSGVGPRTAMTIFSFSDREKVIQAILNSDVSFFTAIPRLGKKNAQKVIIELRNKLGEDSSLDFYSGDSAQNVEVMDALKGFGFSAKEAREALGSIDSEAKSSEDKIKLALKYLGKG